MLLLMQTAFPQMCYAKSLQVLIEFARNTEIKQQYKIQLQKCVTELDTLSKHSMIKIVWYKVILISVEDQKHNIILPSYA